MQIDKERTAEACKMLNKAAIAREVGCRHVVVHMVLTGKYPWMESETAVKILEFVKGLQFIHYVDSK